VGVNAAGCTTGNANVAIGYYANTTLNAFDNTVVVGTGLSLLGITPLPLTQSNQINMGNQNHTLAQIQIPWTVVSDARKKEVKGPVPLGLEFINKLNPIEYQFKNPETGEITDNTIRYGLSAQEVKENEVDPENPIIVYDKNEYLSMTYETLIPVLINSVKELTKRLEAIEGKNP